MHFQALKFEHTQSTTRKAEGRGHDAFWLICSSMRVPHLLLIACASEAAGHHELPLDFLWLHLGGQLKEGCCLLVHLHEHLSPRTVTSCRCCCCFAQQSPKSLSWQRFCRFEQQSARSLCWQAKRCGPRAVNGNSMLMGSCMTVLSASASACQTDTRLYHHLRQQAASTQLNWLHSSAV